MRPSRQFQPLAPVALEERVVLSHVSPHAAAAAAAAAAKKKSIPAHVATPPAPTFPKDIADTLAAGLPVAEQRTTRYSDGSVQTATWQIDPNTTNGTTLTTKVINLRNNGGTESVTDFAYVSANDSNTTTHVITTDHPDGSVDTENLTTQVQGNTTSFNASLKVPTNTGVETFSGQTVTRGGGALSISTTDKTVNVPDGTVDRYHIVTIHHGELKSTTTSTETLPNGQHKVSRWTTTIVRVAPPSATSTGTLLPGATISSPTLG